MMASSQQAIANDPRAYLSAYVSLTPSKEALMQLSGPVAAYMQEQSDPAIAGTYLTAGEPMISAQLASTPVILLFLSISHVKIVSSHFSREAHGNGYASERSGSGALRGVGGMILLLYRLSCLHCFQGYCSLRSCILVMCRRSVLQLPSVTLVTQSHNQVFSRSWPVGCMLRRVFLRLPMLSSCNVVSWPVNIGMLVVLWLLIGHAQ